MSVEVEVRLVGVEVTSTTLVMPRWNVPLN
jgi:hypothetical protein